MMSLQSMWIASRKVDMGFNHSFSISRLKEKAPVGSRNGGNGELMSSERTDG